MSAVEVSGKNLDEAKRLAAEKLGVGVEALSVQVLEETKGLFGKAIVRISATAEAAPAAKAPAAKATKAAVKEAEPVVAEVAAVAEEEAPKAKAKPAPRAKKTKDEEAPVAAAAESGGTEADEEGPQVIATDEDGVRILALVEEILASADLEVECKVSELSGKYVQIELDGRDVAHLVGKHGEVLNALQYLVNIISGRKFSNGVRANLNGNNYRERREAALTSLANRIATEVKNRQEEAVLKALPAFERRIVHKALSTFEGISTYSEGEEPNRCVVIAPAS